MMKYPKISVVTPSYNQAEFIEKTILSVVGQDYPNLEYIIIDGNSSDGSQEIIKKHSKKISYWVSEKDKGQGDALQKGFTRSTGDIMTWINSDDILMPGSLLLVARIFNSLENVSWVSGIPTVINSEGNCVLFGIKPFYYRLLLELGFHHNRMLGFVMQEGTFWRRSLWKKSGSKVDNSFYGLDYNLWRKFAKHASLVPVMTSLAAFRKHGQSKNRDEKQKKKYLKEIHVKTPEWVEKIAVPVRFIVSFFVRKLPLSDQIIFNMNSNQWEYIKTKRLKKEYFLIP